MRRERFICSSLAKARSRATGVLKFASSMACWSLARSGSCRSLAFVCFNSLRSFKVFLLRAPLDVPWDCPIGLLQTALFWIVVEFNWVCCSKNKDTTKQTIWQLSCLQNILSSGGPHLDCHGRSAGFAPRVAGEQFNERTTRLRRVEKSCVGRAHSREHLAVAGQGAGHEGTEIGHPRAGLDATPCGSEQQ